MLNIEEEYDAYCFDEACIYIVAMKKEGKKPMYGEGKVIGKHYTSFSEFYANVTS